MCDSIKCLIKNNVERKVGQLKREKERKGWIIPHLSPL